MFVTKIVFQKSISRCKVSEIVFGCQLFRWSDSHKTILLAELFLILASSCFLRVWWPMFLAADLTYFLPMTAPQFQLLRFPTCQHPRVWQPGQWNFYGEEVQLSQLIGANRRTPVFVVHPTPMIWNIYFSGGTTSPIFVNKWKSDTFLNKKANWVLPTEKILLPDVSLKTVCALWKNFLNNLRKGRILIVW